MSTLELSRPALDNQSSVAPVEGQSPPATRRWTVTVEQLAYILLGIAALVMHLWGLGDRALHHDETLHAAYSWNLYTGKGYIHDPLLHGPFLYYIGSLFFFLFSDNDFTARLGAALFGVALTVMPYLVRRELGRTAALFAAAYLLISPIFLYVGRFVRHDIYSIVFEMLVFVAIVRYASTRRARWLITGAAAFGLMIANQETSYLFLIIMGVPLAGLFLWRVYRPGVVILGSVAVAIAALIFILPGEAHVDGSHNALRDPATDEMQYDPGLFFGWRPLETDDNGYALQIRNRPDNWGGRSLLENIVIYVSDLSRFFGHPAVLLAIGVLLAGVGLLAWLILRRKGEQPSVWQLARERDDGVLAAYASLGSDRRWLAAIGVFLAIYALLFTAFLTNLLGLITGTTGSVLYWLAQHGVERGGQPAHYYVVMLLIYEPLLVLWTLVGMGTIVSMLAPFIGRRVRSRSQQSQSRSGEMMPQTLLLPLLLAWWSIAALAIYSWAGEKMPWLSVHVVLPMVLLSAWAFQSVLRRAGIVENGDSAPGLEYRVADPAAPQGFANLPFAVFGSIFTAVVVLWFVLMTVYVSYDKEIAVPIWLVPLSTVFLVVMLTIAAGIRWGWRWSLAALALCVTLASGLYTFRNAYRLAYVIGDVPREMMIFVQTSPDVTRVVRRLEEASRRRGGGLDIPIIYDNETVWKWYLRDFTNATETGPELAGPPGDEIQAVFMLQENLNAHPQNREYLGDFRVQRMPLRWWLQENAVYRTHAIQTSILDRVLYDPLAYETSVWLWDYLIHRDPRSELGSTDFALAVRPLLAEQIGPGFGGSLSNEP